MASLPQLIKTIILNSPVRIVFNRFLRGNSRKIRGKGHVVHIGQSLLANISILIEENGNTVWIGNGLRLFQTQIVVKGNDCKIQLSGPDYFSGKLICGDTGSTIVIGNGVTSEGAMLVAHEGTSIHVGNDCALGSGVEIHSSDSHAVYDAVSEKRLNPAQNVEIHRHIGMAQESTILKETVIGDGSHCGDKSPGNPSPPFPRMQLPLGFRLDLVANMSVGLVNELHENCLPL